MRKLLGWLVVLVVCAVLAFFIIAAIDPRAANDLINWLDPNNPN